MTEPLPSYDELPRVDGVVPSAWHLFGENDDVGLLNLLDPAGVLAGVAAVRTGQVFPLNADIALFDPPLFGRRPHTHEAVVIRDGAGLDDLYHGFNPQGSSQWDGLGHVAYEPRVFYNGAPMDEITAGHRLSVSEWARRGIAGRAVLLDVTRVADYDPGSAYPITVDDLRNARDAAGVTIGQGDILLLHTGYLGWYAGLDAEHRARIAPRDKVAAPGLAHTEEMARFLWDLHICAIAADNPTVEVWPAAESRADWPFGYLHRVLVAQFGMAIGELWWLQDLAAACAVDGRYDMLLASAPMHAVAGVGSPANAVAIR